ncbi:pentatricopeptide repeat-containing protein At2g02750-like isoform X2 [Bidens hawaiensis]|uniref:pentatricopeptide repeat-containing protein At2g02750-like isoform X1 n=1 Tax=Bidens hawaiensis TaxID=980011 RepID=UPI00404ADBAA
MNTKLSKLVASGLYTEALNSFTHLHSHSHPITNFTFPFILKACTNLQLTSHGQIVHAHITKTGYNSHTHTNTSLIHMYMKFHLQQTQTQFKFQFLNSALKVFDEMPQPDSTSLNAVVSGFVQIGDVKKCFDVFKRFSEFKIRPGSVTIASLLSGCVATVKDGQQVHCWAVKIGVENDIYVATSLVTMYSSNKQLSTASSVFERVRRDCKTVACYNAYLTGLLQNRVYEPVLEIFKEMCDTSTTNTVTFVIVFSACSGTKNLKFGLQVHGLVLKVGLVLDCLLGTAIIDMYSKCGYWHRAYDLFKEMRDVRSLVTWNSMISGMMLNGESENAIGLFMMLESNGLKPDSATWNIMINGLSNLGKPDEAFLLFKRMQSVGEPVSAKCLTSLLSTCACISSLTSGKEIHGYVMRTNMINDEFVASAVINMYMKCGRSSRAFLVFDMFEIKPRDPVIWNTMISGYGRNGESEAAFDMFEQMQNENVKPNTSTFKCVLSVCSHAGKVEKSLEFLRLMKHYNVVPTSEHYACLVDVLGRYGNIDEARGLLSTIPEVSGSVLDSLIGACSFHSDVKTGEEIARLLVDLDPENPIPFVILSNIYAREGRWKEVEDLRNEMDRKGLKKISSFSSLGVR